MTTKTADHILNVIFAKIHQFITKDIASWIKTDPGILLLCFLFQFLILLATGFMPGLQLLGSGDTAILSWFSHYNHYAGMPEEYTPLIQGGGP